MRKFAIAASSIIWLAGCAPAVNNIWVRTDGQPVRNNAALEQQYAIDAEICKGEAQKANLSAGTNYYRGLVAAVAEDVRRDNVMVDVAKGCMASRGYLNVPETQAVQMRQDLAATQKERQRAATAGQANGTSR